MARRYLYVFAIYAVGCFSLWKMEWFRRFGTANAVAICYVILVLFVLAAMFMKPDRASEEHTLTPEELRDILAEKIQRAKIPAMVVTMGGKGAVYADLLGNKGFCPAKKVKVKDTTGAGDAFCAGALIGIYNGCIRFCAAVGIPRMVVHGISLQSDDKENTPQTIEALNYKLYESMIPVLQEVDGVTVCLENLTSWTNNVATEGICFDPHDACRMIDRLNDQAGKACFGLCMDVGHMQLVMKDIRTYAPVLGSRIKCLHIHDNDKAHDSHMLPFTMQLEWEPIVTALAEIGYRGDVTLECGNYTKRFTADTATECASSMAATAARLRDMIIARQ